MKLNRLFALVAVAVMTVGCYEKFETVVPRPVFNDNSFEAMFPDAEHITIKELKEAFGEISNTGVNSAWSNTKYKLVGEDIFAGRDVYIKGKVISNDEDGNRNQEFETYVLQNRDDPVQKLFHKTQFMHILICKTSQTF